MFVVFCIWIYFAHLFSINPSLVSGGFRPPRLPLRAAVVRMLEVGDLVAYAYQIVHVVVAVHQALLLVCRYLERLSEGCADDLYSLCWKIYLELRCWVALHGLKNLLKHPLAHGDGQQPVVEGVVAEDVGEETRHHGAEPCTGNGPCGVLAARAAAEVLACDKDLTAVSRRVEYEVCLGVTRGVVTPVAEEVGAESFARGGLEEACRYDLIGIDVLYRQRHGRRYECCEFVSHGSFL